MDVRVVTHSGEDIIVNMESFDAVTYEQKLNDNELNAVELGGVIFSRIDIKLITPVRS